MFLDNTQHFKKRKKKYSKMKKGQKISTEDEIPKIKNGVHRKKIKYENKRNDEDE